MNRTIVVFAVILAVLAVVVIAVQTVRLSRADAENVKLRAENDALENGLLVERVENERLRSIAERSNRALGDAVAKLEAAADANVARIVGIGDSPSDWLFCPLPDGVRDAFDAYRDGGGNTTDADAGAVRPSEY